MTFQSGAGPLLAALAGPRCAVGHMPAHVAADRFPFDRAGLAAWDVAILSDIGANPLLLHPDVRLHRRTVPNRLRLPADWVADGGGPAMVGGDLPFRGIDGRARWHRRAVEAVLPVGCLPHDDRPGVPEGCVPEVAAPGHPLLEGVPADWPVLPGANEGRARAGAEVVLRLPEHQGGHPLLALGRHGTGRSAAWTFAIGPHRVPREFSDWPGFARLWQNLASRLAGA